VSTLLLVLLGQRFPDRHFQRCQQFSNIVNVWEFHIMLDQNRLDGFLCSLLSIKTKIL
jgi:hypothetical protein